MRGGNPSIARAEAMTFGLWADVYLGSAEVKTLKSYIRRLYVANLVQFFRDKPLAAITPEDVRRYRDQRRGPKADLFLSRQ